jgi:elongator complex protein 1
MRNLRSILYEQWRSPAQFQGRLLTASAWDLANDSVLCTFGPTENDALIELVRVKPKSHSQYVIFDFGEHIYL